MKEAITVLKDGIEAREWGIKCFEEDMLKRQKLSESGKSNIDFHINRLKSEIVNIQKAIDVLNLNPF